MKDLKIHDGFTACRNCFFFTAAQLYTDIVVYGPVVCLALCSGFLCQLPVSEVSTDSKKKSLMNEHM